MPPTGTYRVQVRPDFPLKATAELADYLADLGVSHLYTSPLLAAAPGSQHGYDVVDPTRVNPELGGEDGRRQLVVALQTAGLGLVVDIVPNHAGVAVPSANPAWWDVLKNGPDSEYARFHDIAWAGYPGFPRRPEDQAPEAAQSRGRLLIPVLADEPDALDQ